MDRVNEVQELAEIVGREVADYGKGQWWKATSHFVEDKDRQTYAVIVVPDLPRPLPTGVVVMARIVGDKVVIDEDTTDRPLYEELMRCGIPREQIILAYAGEPLPATEANP